MYIILKFHGTIICSIKSTPNHCYLYITWHIRLRLIAKRVLIKVQSSKVQEDKMFQKTLAENFQRIS